MFKADDFGVVEFFPDGVACFVCYPATEDAPVQRTFGASVSLLEVIRQELRKHEQACWRIAVSYEKTHFGTRSKADPLGQLGEDKGKMVLYFSRHSLGPEESPKFFVELGPHDVPVFEWASETALKLSALVAQHTMEQPQ